MRDLLGFFVGAVGLLFWFIAGNIVIARHYKRRGMPAESGWQPNPDFLSHLNGTEWLRLILVSVGGLTMMVIGVAIARGLHAI
jgi:hypothetical protein